MDGGLVASASSAAVAAVSAVISVYYSQKSIRRAARESQLDYEDSMRAWAERTCDITAELVQLSVDCDATPARDELRAQLLRALRSQIDKGRWYFPNLYADQVGQSKELAYRGIRPHVLEHLVELFRIAKTMTWGEDTARRRLEKLHREFVSEVQQRLNPANRDANYQDFLRRYPQDSEFVKDGMARADAPKPSADSNLG